MRFCAFYIRVPFCLALSVAAEELPAIAPTVTEKRDTLELPASHVEARSAESGPANVNRLDGEALQHFASLVDAVNSLPGFYVRREGGLGGYSELSFRGSDADAVEIDLDGLRLNQEGEESPDLSKWPLLWFDGVEARSGFDFFGAGGTGSLARIDLSTQNEKSRGAEFRGRIGSFSTAEAAASVHGGADWKWTVGVEGQSAKNDYPFFSDNGTFYTTDDDAWLRTQNNAYASKGARASLQHGDASLKQSLSVLWLDYGKEYPGIPNTTSNNSQAYTRHGEWMGAWRLQAYPGQSMLEAGVQAHHFDDAFHDPGQSLGYTSYEEARKGTSIEAHARAKIPLPNRFDVSAETQVSHESVEPTATPFDQYAPSPAATRNEAQLGATLLKKLFDSLSITAEARAAGVFFNAQNVRDFSTDTPHTVSQNLVPLAFRAGARWRTPIGSFEALTRFEERSPSSAQFLGDNHGTLPNLNLNPQKTKVASLGYAWQEKGVELQAVSFYHRYEDPIRLGQYAASPFLRYGNGPTYRAFGLEGDARIDSKNLGARVSETWQSLRILEGPAAGNWPAYQSPVEGYAEVFWKHRIFNADVAIGPTLEVLGPYYNGDINDIPGTHRSSESEPGAHLSAQRRHVNLAFDARNLFDRNYQDFAYSVRSGRSYSLSLSINL